MELVVDEPVEQRVNDADHGGLESSVDCNSKSRSVTAEEKTLRPKKSDVVDGDLYQRGMSLVEHRKQLEHSVPEGCTFKPEIVTAKSYKSHNPAVYQSVDASQRLYEEAFVRKEKSLRRSESRPEECSFEPALHTSKSWASPRKEGKGNQRSDTPTRLYNASREQEERRQALAKKRQEEELSQCTFKPNIKKRPSSAPKTRPSSSNTPSGQNKNVTHRLYEDAAQRDLRLKLEKEKQDLQAKTESNVSIAVNKIKSPGSHRISANNKNTASRMNSFDDSTSSSSSDHFHISGSFEERMALANDRRAKKLEKKREELMEKEMQECTFVPKRSSSTPRPRKGQDRDMDNKRPESPAHIRLLERGEESKKRMEQIRQKHLSDESKNLTFKPTVPSGSNGQTVKNTVTSDVPYYERFARQKEESEMKKKQAKEREDELRSKEYTFKPKSSLKKGLSRSGSRDSVFDRLTVPPSGQRVKDEERMQEAQKELTFSPQVSSQKNGLARASSRDAVFDRLASSSCEHRSRDEERILDEAQKELTFHPKVSVPKRVESSLRRTSDNIYDRLLKDNERRKSTMTKLEKEKIEREVAEHSFSPSLPATSASIWKSKHARASYDCQTRSSVSKQTLEGISSAIKQSPGASPALRRGTYHLPAKASASKPLATSQRDQTTAVNKDQNKSDKITSHVDKDAELSSPGPDSCSSEIAEASHHDLQVCKNLDSEFRNDGETSVQENAVEETGGDVIERNDTEEPTTILEESSDGLSHISVQETFVELDTLDKSKGNAATVEESQPPPQAHTSQPDSEEASAKVDCAQGDTRKTSAICSDDENSPSQKLFESLIADDIQSYIETVQSNNSS